ncbi:M15 family metallopeptidase [Jiulongibacter sediminis]|uniref:M15 family metallopeptidase n=1 Tax=Jiulongibacter sediminis TaxID=1605367 RepID=UPI0006DCEF8F|nr:M15 family metallopeptidase [Jiulongibacter sediminis]TBX24213.1 hypothetical protein TK44_12600 [Jiulongibacter sediminis]
MKQFTFSFLMFLMISACQNEEGDKELKSYQIQIQEPGKTPELAPIGSFEQSLVDQGLVDIQEVDPTIYVDLKYSTTDNFFGEDVYQELTRAYLPLDVAEELKTANELLKFDYPDYRLLVFDAVRPHRIQTILWEALDSIPPLNRKAFVADPALGSLHNYGCAVDLSIYDVRADTLLDMGTKYDYFGHLAYPRKEEEMLLSGQLNEKQIANRRILRKMMGKAGFTPINSEWWHFNTTSLAVAKEKYKLIE